MIVDRNQGLGIQPCASGDVDVSDLVYRTLAGTTTADANEGLGSEIKGISWVWERAALFRSARAGERGGWLRGVAPGDGEREQRRLNF